MPLIISFKPAALAARAILHASTSPDFIGLTLITFAAFALIMAVASDKLRTLSSAQTGISVEREIFFNPSRSARGTGCSRSAGRILKRLSSFKNLSMVTAENP
jgi:hypothetical protein